MESVPEKISAFVEAVVRIFGTMAPALIDMTPSVVAQFNKGTQVNAEVKYFTWAGDYTIPGRPYLRKSTQNHPPLAYTGSFRVQRYLAVYHPPLRSH